MKEETQIYIKEIEDLAKQYDLIKIHSNNQYCISFVLTTEKITIRFNVYFTTRTITVQGEDRYSFKRINESYRDCSIQDFEKIIIETMKEYV